MREPGMAAGDFKLGGGDLRQVLTVKFEAAVGDFSLGSLSFLAVKKGACIDNNPLGPKCWVANLGSGKDIGSVDLEKL